MGCTACTEPQCLYKGVLYLFLQTQTLQQTINSPSSKQTASGACCCAGWQRTFPVPTVKWCGWRVRPSLLAPPRQPPLGLSFSTCSKVGQWLRRRTFVTPVPLRSLPWGTEFRNKHLVSSPPQRFNFSLLLSLINRTWDVFQWIVTDVRCDISNNNFN
jgi:hypothetical protein